MIVTRGLGKDEDVLGAIVAYGLGRKLLEEIIVEGWHIIREFVLRITKLYEVKLER